MSKKEILIIISVIPALVFIGYVLIQVSLYVFTGAPIDVYRLSTALITGLFLAIPFIIVFINGENK